MRASGDDAPSVAFVPLDDRPVTLQLPRMLGAIAGQTVLVPPAPLIGHYIDPGDPQGLSDWLGSAQTRDVSAIVASTDMLVYGGLVASRTPAVPLLTAFARLDRLARVCAERPKAWTALFGTVMRLAPTGLPRIPQTDGYWATGETVDLIQQYANLPDPPSTAEERARAAHLRELIGSATLDAYLGTRARNLDVDHYALQLVAEGDFDTIVLGQDDAGPVGLHLRDLAVLRKAERRFHLGDRASIEPGADELGMVLLARAFAHNLKWTPRIEVIYSRANAGATVDPLEFVPIDTTISHLIETSGSTRVQSGADIDLFVRVGDTSDADEAAFEDAIQASLDAGRSVSIADLSFLSEQVGPQPRELTQALIARKIAGRIDAFASWNTDANTVGTSIATAIATVAGKRAGRYDAVAHAQFMLDRYADDYAFHQFVRPALNSELRGEGIDTTLLLPDVARRAASENRALLWPLALDLLAAIYPGARDAGLTITLPWERTFETKVDARLRFPDVSATRTPADTAR